MQKSRKGFTLIELLAVIVILAIIALIATPIIVGVINKAKKNSFMDTAYGVVEAGKLYYAKNFGNDDFTGRIFAFPADSEELKLSGEKIGGGSIEVTSKGKQVLAIYDKAKNWCASKGEDDSKVIVEKYEEGKCETEAPEPEAFLPSGLTKGTAVYIDPETKTICDAKDAISTTGTKSGCMKWYVYKNNGNKTYQLILDHNTTAIVAWNSSGSNSEMKEVATTLTNDTKVWNKSLEVRLITSNEIAEISGKKMFDKTDATWFYLDSNNQTLTAKTQGASKFAWLFDYTNGCTDYGCNIVDNSTLGYWTSTPVSSKPSIAWYVIRSGMLSSNNVTYSNYGVRPVITV